MLWGFGLVPYIWSVFHRWLHAPYRVNSSRTLRLWDQVWVRKDNYWVTTIIRAPSISTKCRSMQIKIISLIRKIFQCRSLLINANWLALGSMPQFWLALGNDPWSPELFKILCHRCTVSFIHHQESISNRNKQEKCLDDIDSHIWFILMLGIFIPVTDGLLTSYAVN